MGVADWLLPSVNSAVFLNYFYYYYHRPYHLYAGYLQLHTCNKPCFYAIQCWSYSVITIYATCNIFSHDKTFCTLTLALSELCVQCSMWLFSVVPWSSVFHSCCSDIFWMILRRFQLPRLLQVSILFLHSISCISIASLLLVLLSSSAPSSPPL